ncbi:LPS export ABC transporter periplasmic protein LptC [Noviherbaspirillum galbum]|uniref:LPS export ABC transporter periplasmic protein LptC n=1 Tax=Noviherbaspirillum galbum TaxID=2709383 RepID=A0A6B3SSA0_9BURK|nr:LPS export ABC transporter periplasmic protein LptC [Noviherbaspirillum galbum]NEX61322.1 LPS export ABC transporter periplasmic protein LptC [Noviherbaspirillum galbum]
MNESTRIIRFLLLLAPVIALALGSFWLLEVLRRSAGEATPDKVRVEPDFYIDKFSYVKLAPDGRAQYHFAGERLTHNPRDDSYDIRNPVIRTTGKSASPMSIRSDRAHVSNDNSEVHMYDHVQMDRPATADGRPLQLRSDYLLVLPDDDVMKTDKPVVITSGEAVLNGVGMVANNATRELRLLNNVHGTYQPATRQIR